MEFETLPDSPVQRQLRRRFSEFHLVLSKESDRGILLTGAAALEEVLEAILRSRFAAVKPKPKSVIDPLFNSVGPLSTFAAKIKLCYASDYIHEWVYRDLEIIRSLRNEAAHSFESFSLSSGKRPQRIERLTSPKIAQRILERTAPMATSNQQEHKERSSLTGAISYILGYLTSQVLVLDSELPPGAKERAAKVDEFITRLLADK